MTLNRPIVIRPKTRKKKRLRRVLLLTLVFMVLLTTSLYFFLNWRIKKELKEIEDLRFKNEQLRNEIKNLRSGEGYYEEMIRKRLGYIREGERLLIYHQPNSKNRAEGRR